MSHAMLPTEARYRVALGPVTLRKLEYGDPAWATFNASFQNCEMTQTEIADALRSGRPITTQHRNRWRHSRNYVCGQHLGVDFDAGDETSTIACLLLDPFVTRYGAFVYTTPSHTEQAPRARAIFLLDAPIFQAVNYAQANTALLQQFGTADRQCKDACRFFYGGKPGGCELEMIGETLPLDLVRNLIRECKPPERKPTTLCAPHTYETPDRSRVVAALRKIDPWELEYDQWVSILMAVHSSLGDGGLDIAEQWADGQRGEVQQKWRGFKPNGGIGPGTLFALAKRLGLPDSTRTRSAFPPKWGGSVAVDFAQ